MPILSSKKNCNRGLGTDGSVPGLFLWVVWSSLIGAALLASGCADVTARFPAVRLESPEVVGENMRLQVVTGVATVRQVQLSPDASVRPPVTTPNFSLGDELPVKMRLGLGSRFEAGVRGQVFLTSPWMFEGKFQILGDSTKDAKSGNFSLAVSGGLGIESVTENGTQLGTFGPGGYYWSSTFNMSVQDVAAILGYRVSDNVLFYGGLYQTNNYLSGNIHDAASDNGQSPLANYPLSGTGSTNGGNFGIEFFFGTINTAFLMLEVDSATFVFTGVPSTTTLAAGGAFGVNFK